MDVAYISAMSALVGSVVGGLSSSGTAWLAHRAQAREGLVAREMALRQDLYRDFIVAASKAYGDALTSSEPQLADLVSLYAMVSRMRVFSSQNTTQSADKVMRSIMDTYFSPNKSVRELRDMLKDGSRADMDALRDFSEIAREELHEDSRRT